MPYVNSTRFSCVFHTLYKTAFHLGIFLFDVKKLLKSCMISKFQFDQQRGLAREPAKAGVASSIIRAFFFNFSVG